MNRRIESHEVEAAVKSVREAMRAAKETASRVEAASRQSTGASATPEQKAAAQQAMSQAQSAHSTTMNRLQQARGPAQELLQRCEQELTQVRNMAREYEREIQGIKGREAAAAARAVKFDRDINQLEGWITRLQDLLEEAAKVGRISGGSLESRLGCAAGGGLVGGGLSYGAAGANYGFTANPGYDSPGTGYAGLFGAGRYRPSYAPSLDSQLAPYRGPRAVVYVRETYTVTYQRVREFFRYIW